MMQLLDQEAVESSGTLDERMFVHGFDGSGLLEGLNDEQRTAVVHEGGPLLVLAGAGTGKTTTLCSRVAWLVGQGVAPERILLLTFTRRAAREMLDRATTLLGSSATGHVFGGTFHSTGQHLIRRHAAALGLRPNFALFDAADAADLLNLLRSEAGLATGKDRFPKKKTLLDIYSHCVNAQKPLSTVIEESFPWCEPHREQLAQLFELYVERKRELAVLDFDDLLLYWHALVHHEAIGPRLAAMFDHVLVDEYQDLNALQVEIVRELRRTDPRLTAVGDDLQAIYSFRAASADHILNFRDHFPAATIVTLERNYRSTQPILDLANEVAASASHAYPKQLRADRAGTEQPTILLCRDQSEEATQLCDRALALYEEGAELKDQAVLMRAGHHSIQLELELTRRRIPFRKYGGIGYLDAAHIKDLASLLRLANNINDQLAWFRVLQLAPRVGPVTASSIYDGLDPGTLESPDQLLERWQPIAQALKPPSRDALSPIIEALSASSETEPLEATVTRLRDAIAPLIGTHYPNPETRVPDLDQLVIAASEGKSLATFLTELALDPPSSSAKYAGPPQLEDDYLVLSTVHSAKGLEWHSVHLIGATDGNFPSDMALSTPDGLEEERRLFYVALTRARQTLTVYVPRHYYHQPNNRTDPYGYTKATRFLSRKARATCEIIKAPEHDADLSSYAATGRVTVELGSLWR